MYQIVLNITFDNIVKGKKKHQMYFDIDDCKCLTEDKFKASYGFQNKVDNIAFVKPAFYPKVLIITSKFNIRYTNWDSIKDAKSEIKDNDIESRKYIIDKNVYYIIAHDKEDLSDLNLPIVSISDEPFEDPNKVFDDDDIIKAKFDCPIFGKKEHIFAFHQTDDYIDGENIEQTYNFNNDHSKIALIKPKNYKNVIIITEKFKIRVTPWKTMYEANYALEQDELVCHKVSMEKGDVAYVVANLEDDISDMWIRMPQIERVEYVEDDADAYSIVDGTAVYVTKATAYSMAYRACLYLNKKKGIKDLTPKESDMKKYQELFIKQSRKFLKIYSELIGCSDSFVDSLDDKECLRYFHEKTKKKIIESFRCIFHNHIKCKWMYNDYKENDIIRPNTGIYTLENIYTMNSKYLKELGFRLCMGCEKGISIPKGNTSFSSNPIKRWDDDDLELLKILYYKKKCDVSLITQVFKKEEFEVQYQLEHFLVDYEC